MNVLTNVGHGVIISLEAPDPVEVAGREGLVVRSQSFQQLVVRMVLDTTIVKLGSHAV